MLVEIEFHQMCLRSRTLKLAVVYLLSGLSPFLASVEVEYVLDLAIQLKFSMGGVCWKCCGGCVWQSSASGGFSWCCIDYWNC